MPHRRLQFLIMLGVLYVGAHTCMVYLSAGQVFRAWGISDTFLYVPGHPDWVVTNSVPLHLHYALRFAFYPVWKTQEHLLGGPLPMQYPPMLGIDGLTRAVE